MVRLILIHSPVLEVEVLAPADTRHSGLDSPLKGGHGWFMVRVLKRRRGEHEHHAGDNRGLPWAPSSRTGGVPTLSARCTSRCLACSWSGVMAGE